ncbi:hypothetical protein Nepgr_029461 [Nepenthes gracilis]|uniref:CLAVATA3/ESR (CLE)-related protein 25-like n=1 Tax=Nepenthes gracilis TaxID=150966 RepID=A0AAD3TCI0_NEPGR|nr:hypothetical protein Nepgr_029461 [Nepenthes gracilis]
MTSCSSNRLMTAVILEAFLLLWLLAGASIASREIRTAAAATSSARMEVVTAGKLVAVQPTMDINSMNKRRVPNGPDPIHNRRAGNSRQPPGRA